MTDESSCHPVISSFCHATASCRRRLTPGREVAVKAPHVGEAAIDLPWLSPCAATLVAFARAETAPLWDDVRSDPGAVLLIARHLPPEAGGTALAAALRNADTLPTALPILAAPG